MSKIIKSVLLIAVAVAIVVFAAPIAAAFAASTFGVGAVGATLAIVHAIGISLALSALGSLFRKTPTMSDSTLSRLNTTVVPTTPRKIVFGTTAAGTDIRYFEIYGSDQIEVVQVIALASHQVHAIKQFYVDTDLTWQANGDGTQLASNQTVNGSIVHNNKGFNSFRAVPCGNSTNATGCASGSIWTRTATFTGCAYLLVDWHDDSKVWTSGLPTKVTTIVDGCPVYDPRLDTSVGGSGPHRIADQATWSFVNGSTSIGRNPALCLLTYLIGWRLNGKLMWGMGVPASAINIENFKTYANICEEQVLLANGVSTIQRYTCDGIFSTSDTHETVISAISAAMGSCQFTDVGGLYGFIGGYDDTMGPIQAYYETDIVGGQGSPSAYHWQPSGTTSETYNIVEGQFADPTQLYQLTNWGTIEVDPLPDSIRRSMTLDLACVNRAETCQRIAKQNLLRETLAQGMFTCNMGPRGFIVEVGSLVTWTVPSMGWQNKLFRVQEQHEVHDMIYQMTFREEDSAVYAWDMEETAIPLAIAIPGYDPSFAITPKGMSLSTVVYTGV